MAEKNKQGPVVKQEPVVKNDSNYPKVIKEDRGHKIEYGVTKDSNSQIIRNTMPAPVMPKTGGKNKT